MVAIKKIEKYRVMQGETQAIQGHNSTLLPLKLLIVTLESSEVGTS